MIRIWPTFDSVRRAASRRLPNVHSVNYLIAVPVFWRSNRRLPRKPTSATATINDYIFARMIRDDWTQLERLCVDKEYAKIVAVGLSRDVRVARTLAAYCIDRRTNLRGLQAWLEPFLGRHLVAKPTHGSGCVLFLDRENARREIPGLLAQSRKNLFHIVRETQYKDLEPKIIVEENLARPDETLIDYKFFCSNGVVHCCQVDVDRFTGHKRALYTVPDFRQLQVRYGYDIPDATAAPSSLSEMLEVARSLSLGFDFVRIDLYDTAEGIFFGEFTFSPCSGSNSISDEGVRHRAPAEGGASPGYESVPDLGSRTVRG